MQQELNDEQFLVRARPRRHAMDVAFDSPAARARGARVFCPSQYLWRANALPPTSSLQYGFTQFAIELNELTDAMRSTLPPTDSRFRPDQRYGQCEAAAGEAAWGPWGQKQGRGQGDKRRKGTKARRLGKQRGVCEGDVSRRVADVPTARPPRIRRRA